MRSLKNLMPSSKKMKIISVLLSLLLLASANEAMAEHWELVEKGGLHRTIQRQRLLSPGSRKRTRVLETQTRIQ